jgi:hypothetical protein
MHGNSIAKERRNCIDPLHPSHWIDDAVCDYLCVAYPDLGARCHCYFGSLTVAFVVWQSSNDPAGKEHAQRAAAKELLWMREQLLLLIMDAHLPSVPDEKLQQEARDNQPGAGRRLQFAPNTSAEAYARAEAMIKSGHIAFSNDEIDNMLPAELRKNKVVR